MAELTAVHGNPLIGLYARVSDDFAVVGIRDGKFESLIREELDVDVVRTTVCGSELAGAMVALNSKGIVVCGHVMKKELEMLEKSFEVLVLETEITCMGNVIAINDHGALVHPDLGDDVISKISEFFDLDVHRATIGGIKTVGMSAVVTNKGALVNPNTSEWELKKVEEVLGVEPVRGTVNFGSEMVGTGVVANSKGYIAGRDTTGFELGVIEEALGFL
ncbi:translation initiation factor IF-6 [Geoglobus acetivorans]|uniref:Translation initiation factor 6 n=1 Tax=Geoglobus acetivorans TaxID=565033 RepID=A0ABZ3H6V0_GEOAI|nr:translation initiation factor IF-6 [Geoglobus acetivorans]